MNEPLRSLGGATPHELLLWVVLAAATALALGYLLRPLARRDEEGPDEAALSVYRDQLGEVERDRARGLLGPEEAEAARAEISRRLLAAAETDDGSSKMSSGWRKTVALVVVIAVPAISLALYLGVGAPSLPDQPLQARLDRPAEELPVEGLIVKVEERLRAEPDDAQGWAVIAPIYLRVERFDDAVRAYREALILSGPDADLYAGFGEALAAQAGGSVTPDAARAFEAALELDPGLTKAGYFLGVRELEAGNRQAAIAQWRAALANADPSDPATPWFAAQLSALEQAEAPSAAAPSAGALSSAAPEIGDEQMAAMASLTAEERNQMIAGMVSGLADRLEGDPNDLQGWLRLVRAYAVMGRSADAEAALAQARSVFAGDAEALAQLDRAQTALNATQRGDPQG